MQSRSFQLALILVCAPNLADAGSRARVRDLGLTPGILPTGPHNAITDVAGVRVGHVTLKRGEKIRTGVTAIVPPGNIFRNKLPAAMVLGNGFGKLAGYSQVKELGTLETPIVLTNTLGIAAGLEGLIRYTLAQPGNEDVGSVNAVVGETNDGRINDIRGMHVRPKHVQQALAAAKPGAVVEGSVGAGTGTVAFGYKGGIGTSSRRVGKHTVGVLVQANYGGILTVLGAPVGMALGSRKGPYTVPDKASRADADGSCMIIVATDAPVDVRNLERMAKRALFGLGRTGSTMSNGSGDYVIAFSTAYRLRDDAKTTLPALIQNDAMDDLFLASMEATEEALLNAVFTATTIDSPAGRRYPALPVKRALSVIRAHGLGATK